MLKCTKYLWVFFVIFGLIVLKGVPDGKLHLIMCDIGQGDAFLLSYNHVQVLIDGGPDDRVVGCLRRSMPMWDRTVELVVATHPDADHITGLEPVLTTYKVDQIITSGTTKNTTIAALLSQRITDKHIPLKVAQQGEVIIVGPLKFRVLWPAVVSADGAQDQSRVLTDLPEKNPQPTIDSTDDANARSVVLRLEFGDFSALFTGDLPAKQEITLVSSGVLESTTLLKVAHHGSANSTTPQLLTALRARIALISVGAKNRYGHPSRKVLDLLEKNAIRIFRTDTDGAVELESDGKHVWKKQSFWHKIPL